MTELAKYTNLARWAILATLAQRRVIAEHVNRRLKIWRILSDRYRNRRKRFG